VNTASAGTVNANAAGVNVGTISNTATVNVGGANSRVTTLAGGTVNANAAGLVVTNFNGGNIAVSNGVTVGLRSGSSSGVISGSGGIAKQSAGTLTLSGANTYSGDTTVEQGKLVVNGSIQQSAVTVASGAVLGGSGTVGDTTILSGAKIGPGNSPGTLNIAGDLTWSGGGSYDWEIYNAVGAAGSEWDLIDVDGSLLFSGLSSGNTFTINVFSLSALPNTVGALAGWNSATSWSWTILSAGSGMGAFNANNFTLNTANFTSANSLDGGTFSLAADGGDLNLLFTAGAGPGPSPVPEPGTWAAAVLLAGAAGYVRWRRRKEQPKDA
jgi:MYXO-CTERM domain-containing protein